MAARKKAKKSKAKKAKKTKSPTRRKKTAKTSPVRRSVGKARKKAQLKGRAKKKAQRAATRKPAAKQPAPATSRSAAAGEPAAGSGERIGVVMEYQPPLALATVQLENGSLRVGEMVRIKGNGSDFTQTVGWLEVDRVHVDEVHAGQTFGLRVDQPAREQDVVYKVLQ